MQDKKLQEMINTVREYFKGNLPSTVTEYMKDSPEGCSRTSIKKHTGLACGPFLKLAGAAYKPPERAAHLLRSECKRLEYKFPDIDLETFKRRDRVDLECLICGNVNNTTVDSLRGSTLGCPRCKSKNFPWYKRREELEKLIASRLSGKLIGDIPTHETGYVSIQCSKCMTEYKTQLVGVTCPNSPLRATCPNCRDTDRRVVLEGITFGSTFESKCYLELKVLSPELHVLYSEYFDTNRRWVCDFKIGNYWIEVSNFKIDYKGYFSNIEDKRGLVETNSCKFVFLRSLAEVRKFVLDFTCGKI